MTDRDAFITGCNQLEIYDLQRKIEKVDLYIKLLKKWNKHFNLIAESTLINIYKRHVLDCAQLVKFVEPNQKVLDIGTGAGLPSVILSIFMDTEIHAVERNGKKVQFLNEITRKLELNSRFFIHHCDIESLPNKFDAYFDVITARAFAPTEEIIKLGTPYLSQSGKFILLKGENIEKEISGTKVILQMTTELKESITSNNGKILIVYRST